MTTAERIKYNEILKENVELKETLKEIKEKLEGILCQKKM